MNQTETLEPEPQFTPEPYSEPAPTPKKRRFGLWLILMLLLLLGGSGGFAYKLWHRLEHSEQARNQEIERASGQVEQLRQHVHDLQARLETDVESRLDGLYEQHKALERSLKTLYVEQHRQDGGKNWSMAEILYLLGIAHQRLLLAQDIDSALAALQAADKRLAQSRDPRFIEVREQVGRDIQALRDIEQPDIAGFALKLSEYIRKVDDLPLYQGYQSITKTAAASAEAADEPVREDPAENWQEAAEAIWGQLEQLVTVRYNTSNDAALLAPEQRYFLRENLRLHLENARFFLIRRDTAQFHAALELIQGWLEQYYDQHAASIQTLMQDIEHMRGVALTFPLPNLNLTLEALQAISDQDLEAELKKAPSSLDKASVAQ